MSNWRYIRQLERSRKELIKDYTRCCTLGFPRLAEEQWGAIERVNAEIERLKTPANVEPTIVQVQGAQIENAARNEWHGLEARIGFTKE